MKKKKNRKWDGEIYLMKNLKRKTKRKVKRNQRKNIKNQAPVINLTEKNQNQEKTNQEVKEPKMI